jgi:hypothetical protein
VLDTATAPVAPRAQHHGPHSSVAPAGPAGPPGVQVTYAPLCDAAALLDTSGPVRLLHLDIDSPAARVPRLHLTPRPHPGTPR